MHSGGLLYMVAYNLRKVENRDRYPDPPCFCTVRLNFFCASGPSHGQNRASRCRGTSRLAQLVERKTLNLVVVGSSPTVGNSYHFWCNSMPKKCTPKSVSALLLKGNLPFSDKPRAKLSRYSKMTTVGLEPTIFGSEDRRLIHWATRPFQKF